MTALFRLFTPLIAALAATVLTAGPAGQAQATGHGLPEVLRPAVPNLFPEGVAWDPTRQALLVGSVGTPARISAVGRDGVARTVVSDPGLVAFLGLKVDPVRGRIVAVTGLGTLPGPAGLAVYDLATGARELLVDLSGDGRSPNDVALDPWGNAYVTDTGAGSVYRVGLDGTVTTLVTDPRLGPAPGVNGVAWHPAGLLVANHTTGRLFRVTGGRLTELRLPRPLVGADGIAVRRDGTLVVVTNALLGLPGSRIAVHELVLGRNFALPYRVTDWPDPAPTTVAVTPYGDYVVDGHLDSALAGQPVGDFVLRRL